MYFSAWGTKPTILTQLIDPGQSEDKRLAFYKVSVFPNWEHTNMLRE